MSAKSTGRDAEIACVADLEKAGHLAFRVHLSQGPFDVVGISVLGVRFIQVKARTKHMSDGLSPAQLEAMKEQIAPWLPPHATFEIWVRGKINRRWKWVRQERLL